MRRGRNAGRGATPANPACATAAAQPDDTTDNRRSVAFVLRYGSFDFYDAGDLTGDVEAKLACPVDRVGPVDLYQVTHHGQANSNNPVLLASLKPTVAVMNNGPRKGGAAETFQRLKALPSLKGLFAIHKNASTGPEVNAAPENIANLEAPATLARRSGRSIEVALTARRTRRPSFLPEALHQAAAVLAPPAAVDVPREDFEHHDFLAVEDVALRALRVLRRGAQVGRDASEALDQLRFDLAEDALGSARALAAA